MANSVTGIRRGVMAETRLDSQGRVIYETSAVYRVATDSPNTNAASVLATSGVPAVGDLVDAGVFGQAECKSVRPQQLTQNASQWDVTVRFSTERRNDNSSGGGGGGQGSPFPIAWIPKVSISFETITETYHRDWQGNRVESSAGELWTDGIQEEVPIVVWKFTQYEEPSLTLDQFTDRIGAYNDGEWKGYPEHTWKCFIESPTETVIINGYVVWQVNYVLKYRKDNWLSKRYDIGTYYLNNGVETPFDRKGVPGIGAINGFGGSATIPAIREFYPQPGPISFDFLRI